MSWQQESRGGSEQVGWRELRGGGNQGSEDWLESRSTGCDLDSISFKRKSVSRKSWGREEAVRGKGGVSLSSSTNLVLSKGRREVGCALKAYVLYRCPGRWLYALGVKPGSATHSLCGPE